jgi:hypothetical protein
MSYVGLLTDTITVATMSGVDGHGDPAFNTQATMSARVEFGTRRVYAANGTERQCEAVLMTEAEIPMGARIWLPGTNTAVAREAKIPIAIKRASNPSGGLTVYETYL